MVLGQCQPVPQGRRLPGGLVQPHAQALARGHRRREQRAREGLGQRFAAVAHRELEPVLGRNKAHADLHLGRCTPFLERVLQAVLRHPVEQVGGYLQLQRQRVGLEQDALVRIARLQLAPPMPGGIGGLGGARPPGRACPAWSAVVVRPAEAAGAAIVAAPARRLRRCFRPPRIVSVTIAAGSSRRESGASQSRRWRAYRRCGAAPARAPWPRSSQPAGGPAGGYAVPGWGWVTTVCKPSGAPGPGCIRWHVA